MTFQIEGENKSFFNVVILYLLLLLAGSRLARRFLF